MAILILRNSITNYKNWRTFTQSFKHALRTNITDNEGKDELDITSVTSNSQDYKIGKVYATKQLMSLFNFRHKAEAAHIVNKHKILSNVACRLIRDNYHLCKKYEVTNEVLLSFPVILAQRKLKDKLKLLEELNLDLREALPLVQLPDTDLKYISAEYKEIKINRIVYYTELMNVR